MKNKTYDCPRCQKQNPKITGITPKKWIFFQCTCGHEWHTNHQTAISFARATGKVL